MKNKTLLLAFIFSVIALQGKAQITEDFMVIARIESLILDQGIDDAIMRARVYLEAGVDGIMIHSRQKDPTEIFDFCKRYHDSGFDKPLVVVPSSYNATYEKELEDAGVKVVIYANHLLRAAYPSMMDVAQSILTEERSLEVDNRCMAIKEILDLIPGTR